MTAMEKKPVAASTHDLAMRIYAELIGRNTQITESGVKMNSSAANIAALSLRLADAFEKASNEADAARAPVTSYKVEGSDIAEWSK
jgi:membrane-bound ClpP family serine protease